MLHSQASVKSPFESFSFASVYLFTWFRTGLLNSRPKLILAGRPAGKNWPKLAKIGQNWPKLKWLILSDCFDEKRIIVSLTHYIDIIFSHVC